jgi:glycosyltransferase involved in cell wall biosynthesis
MIKIAYGSIPKDGGTFTFYRNQRPALQKLGYELLCVSVGKHEASLVNKKFVDEGCILLAGDEKDIKKQSQLFVEWCVKNEIPIVIGVNSEAIISAIPNLPSSIKIVSRAANAFHEGYAYATHALTRISKIVALVPLLRNELIRDYQVPGDLIEIIPNGVDLTKFIGSRNFISTKEPIRILFVGRLEHKQKGVLHIPKILQELEILNIPYHLTIVGNGKHKEKLRKELERITKNNFMFLGSLDSKNVINQLFQHDVFLFTSHFEGCPNALLEAMVGGCVPVSWRLEGITDFIIDDKKTGFLHMMNDYNGMASSIEKLYHDPSLLSKMSQAVAKVARERFSNEVCALEYAKIFDTVLQEQKINQAPLSWDYFKPVQAQKSRFSFIPLSVRNTVKKLIFK